MTSTMINPYRKTYKVEIVDKITENEKVYGKLLHYPAFMGSINVEGDEFKINGKEPVRYKNNSEFYLIDNDLDYVEVSINWKKRLGIMQQNLSNALFRHFIEKSTDFEILNYKVNERGSYVDIKAKDLRFLTMNNLEEMTNYAISSNLKVASVEGGIEIDGIGKIYYEGPSLARTGEAAILFIRNVSKKEDYLRIYLIAGEAAFKYAKGALNNLNNIKMYLGSKNLSEVFSDVKKLKSGIYVEKENTSEENIKTNENTYLSTSASHENENIKDSDVKETESEENLKTSDDENKSLADENKNIDEENKNINEESSKFMKSLPKEDNKDNVENLEKSLESSNKEENKQLKLEDIEAQKNSKNLSSEDKDSSEINVKKTETIQENSKTPLRNNNNKDLDNAVSMFKKYATEVNGISYIYKVLSDINIQELKDVSTVLMKEDNFVQIYGIKNGQRSKIMILRSQNLNFNLKGIFDNLQKHYKFTGSGNLFTLNIECDTIHMAELMEVFLIEIRRALA